jgi:IclR family transcriptional regulator, acetate operon repressor
MVLASLKSESSTIPIPGESPEAGALQRGLLLLELMVNAGRALTLTELSELSNLHASTVHRLMQTLTQSEHVFRDGAKRYYAGPRSYLPLSLYHPFNVLRRDSYETLRTLRDRFGVTCGLSVFIGTQRLVVELAVASDTLSPYYQTHLTSPLHAAASGKLLLLNFPAEQRRDLLGPAPYLQYTPHTITDAEAVERDLALTAERGYAVSLNENFKGISAVGAPINVTPQRTVGAITFAGPSAHFTSDTVPEMGTAARQAADLLALGSPGVRAVRQQLGF